MLLKCNHRARLLGAAGDFVVARVRFELTACGLWEVCSIATGPLAASFARDIALMTLVALGFPEARSTIRSTRGGRHRLATVAAYVCPATEHDAPGTAAWPRPPRPRVHGDRPQPAPPGGLLDRHAAGPAANQPPGTPRTRPCRIEPELTTRVASRGKTRCIPALPASPARPRVEAQVRWPVRVLARSRRLAARVVTPRGREHIRGRALAWRRTQADHGHVPSALVATAAPTEGSLR